jgi:uncharacterized protein YjiS (DUF1127 family)
MDRHMEQIITNIREAARKRAQYRETVTALESLPLDVALDLDIYPREAEKIARQAVYGR